MFVSQIASNGRKIKQRTVTRIRRKQNGRIPNEVADVELALNHEGHVVCAWSDTREGHAEIYEARLSSGLEKLKLDRRISRSAGASMEPRLQKLGNKMLLAWSDQGDASGQADIRVQLLHSISLNNATDIRTLETSPGHSRSPQWFGTSSDSLALGWIDEPAEGDRGSMKLVALQTNGEPLGNIRSLRMPEGRVTSMAGHCGGDSCRGVLLGHDGAALGLAAYETPRGSTPKVKVRSVGRLRGRSQHDRSLLGLDPQLRTLLFAHPSGRSGGTSLRRLQMEW